MVGNKKINFKNGLRKLLKIQFPNFKLKPASVDLLSQLLNEVNEQLVTAFDGEFKSASTINESSSQLFSKKAVDKTFKGLLRKHAVSEAHRQLALFESGIMKYDCESDFEKAKSAAKAARKGKRKGSVHNTPQAHFKAGIGKLAYICQPDLSLNSKAKEFLGLHLHNFVRRVAEKANESAVQDEVQPIVFRRTLAKFLGSDVMKIANSEGNRSLALYANGFISFRPKKPHKLKDTTKVKKKDEESVVLTRKMFRNGIRKFLTELVQNAHVEPKGSSALEDALRVVAECLASQAAEACQSTGAEEMSEGDIRQAVEELFPDMLMEHALIQGNADVSHYNNGFLKFKPRIHKAPKGSESEEQMEAKQFNSGSRKTGQKSGKTRPGRGKSTGRKALHKKGTKRKANAKDEKPAKKVSKEGTKDEKPSKKEAKMDFTSALLDLASKTFPNSRVSINKDTTKAIGDILEGVCNMLVANIIERAKGGGELRLQNVLDSMRDVFPIELGNHAFAFGSNVLSLNFVDGDVP